MHNFQDNFETHEQSFISDFSICMTVLLMYFSPTRQSNSCYLQEDPVDRCLKKLKMFFFPIPFFFPFPFQFSHGFLKLFFYFVLLSHICIYNLCVCNFSPDFLRCQFCWNQFLFSQLFVSILSKCVIYSNGKKLKSNGKKIRKALGTS